MNQAPPLEGHDLFACNAPLAEALEREGAGWAADAFRARTGSAYGTLPSSVDARAIVERHRPVV